MAARLLTPLLLVAFAVCGCAAGPDPRDPMEAFNRKVYAFNHEVDKAVLKPVAKGYVAVVPQLMRRGVTNFFNNLGMAVTTVNDALQLKGSKVPVDFARFATNMVFGLGGLIDVASELKIENRNEDFGQTLGYWGVPGGPYVVLPFLGNFTLRDASALPVDFKGDMVTNLSHRPTRFSLKAVNLIDSRSEFLNASSVLDAAALDKYTFTRDAHLQRRRSAVYDGNPPDEDADADAKPPAK